MFPGGTTDFQRPDVQRADTGAVAKCDFCYHRIDEGREPACVEVCPTKARIFGVTDGSDPERSLDHLIEQDSTTTLLPEKGTKPSVYYVSRGE